MANFNYSKPFPAQLPNSQPVFQRSFKHRPWVDSQDVVQAAETPDEEGFNSRLHKIENDLDALSADSIKAFALIAENRTHFGLNGSVWSADPERAAVLAARLECGTSWVNTHAMPTPGVPFGGHKWSGLGVAGGLAGLLSFTETKVLHVVRGD